MTPEQAPTGVNLDKVNWLKQDMTHSVGEKKNDEREEDSIAFAEAITEEIRILNTEVCKSENFQQSKEKEIENLKKFDVYTEVDRRDYADQDVRSCKWVETEKQGHDQNTIYKSRLCVRGFEEKNPPKGS